jgi:hypothetical protein
MGNINQAMLGIENAILNFLTLKQDHGLQMFREAMREATPAEQEGVERQLTKWYKKTATEIQDLTSKEDAIAETLRQRGRQRQKAAKLWQAIQYPLRANMLAELAIRKEGLEMLIRAAQAVRSNAGLFIGGLIAFGALVWNDKKAGNNPYA